MKSTNRISKGERQFQKNADVLCGRSLKVVLDPHVSRSWGRHAVELVPVPIVPLLDVAAAVVRQIEPQEIRGAEVGRRVAVREVATVAGDPDHAGVVL